MPEVVAKVEIASDSGLVADRFTNTFAIRNVPDLSSAVGTELINCFIDFYKATATGALQPLTDYYSPEVDVSSPTSCAVKLYDATGHLAGSSMGAPYYQETFGWNGAAGVPAGLPAEVAYCVTLEALNREDQPVETADGGDPGSERDRPMQRYTGRIYLGPLNVNVLSVVNGQVRPGSNIRDTSRLAVGGAHRRAVRQLWWRRAGGVESQGCDHASCRGRQL